MASSHKGQVYSVYWCTKARTLTMSDARHILQNHYRDASRLDKRIQLHTTYSTNTQGLHAWVFERFHLTQICQVLEIGCGSGPTWLVIQQRLPEVLLVTTSDSSA